MVPSWLGFNQDLSNKKSDGLQALYSFMSGVCLLKTCHPEYGQN